MPHVNVIFDPACFSGAEIAKLKKKLQIFVAVAFSDESVCVELDRAVSIATKVSEIMVLGHPVHPTDVNVPPIEIYIQAGRPKGRSGDKIVALLGKMISMARLIPNTYLGEGQAGIFVVFHEYNGFGFIPASN